MSSTTAPITKSSGRPTWKSDASMTATNMTHPVAGEPATGNPLSTINSYSSFKYGNSRTTKWDDLTTRPDSQEKRREYEGE